MTARFILYLPNHSDKFSSDRLGLVCVLFDILLEKRAQQQSAEAKEGMVTSNNKKLSQFLTMLLRSKKFPELLDQMQYALFVDVESDGTGILAAQVDGEDFAFRLRQYNPPPQLKWLFEPIDFARNSR